MCVCIQEIAYQKKNQFKAVYISNKDFFPLTNKLEKNYAKQLKLR